MTADLELIDALLPQTQCRRCGYDGCRPYAAAVADGRAPINRCPPGGSATIDALATLLGREPLPLSSDCGTPPVGVAWIDPQRCIGCARCLPACPVDAIVGAQRYLHSVLGSDCTGCELCLAPCPVDCIVMQPRSDAAPDPIDNRRRYLAQRERTARRAQAQAALLAERKRAVQP